MTTNIDRAVHVINETYADEYVKPHMSPTKVATALHAAGLLAPDLPKPHITDDGWAEWGGLVEFHPTKGLWSYDDGVMSLDSPGRLIEVALIYLAAAKYAEENQ